MLLSGQPIDAVLALVNQANPLPIALSPKDLYLGKVRERGDGSGLVDLPTTAMYDSQYEGYVTLSYKRIDLTSAFTGIRPQISALGQATLHLLLPTVNRMLGTNIQPDDVTDVNLGWLGGNEQVNIEIKARPESLTYKGSFVITFTRLRPMLDLDIRVKQLATLKHPGGEVEGKRSVGAMTWGLDFSDYADTLKTWSNGSYRDSIAVNKLMAEFGFAGWPTPTGSKPDKYSAGIYATKDVPGANRDYELVVVQIGVEADGYAGTAYLHYNRL